MICVHCKEEIIEDSKWLKDTSKVFHYDCYIEHKLASKKARKREIYEAKAEELYQNRIGLAQANKLKDDFWEYIQFTYNISLIPTFTFIKMSSINNGTYKGLNKPVPLDDLFHMFKSKREVLDKIYANNVAKGMSFDNLGRFNYDTAILLGQYDKYLSWKEANKIKEFKQLNTNEMNKSVKINKMMERNNVRQLNTEDEIDVDNILDDLYE